VSAALGAARAEASSFGTVQATLQYVEHNNGFCDNITYRTLDCTGTKYAASQFLSHLALRNVKVRIADSSNLTLGVGYTDANGFVSIPWSSWATPVLYMQLEVRFRQQDGAFQVRKMSGDVVWRSFIFVPNPVEGGTTSLPDQTVGGTLNAITDVAANAYAAAMRVWDVVDKYAVSRDAWLGFTSPLVDIRIDHPSIVGYDPAAVVVYLLDNPEIYDGHPYWYNQSVVNHELGHHLWRVLRPYAFDTVSLNFDYAFPDDPVAGSHFFSTPEHRSAAMEEGFADFVEVVSLWNPDSAVAPLTCVNYKGGTSLGACNPNGGGTYNVETSLGTCTGATGFPPENRWELSVLRYLWDIVDPLDASEDDDLDRSVSTVFFTIYDTPTGFDDHQASERFASDGSVDNEDGRRGYDFYYVARFLATNRPFNSANLYRRNCNP
jgi:hypothetical protein